MVARGQFGFALLKKSAICTAFWCQRSSPAFCAALSPAIAAFTMSPEIAMWSFSSVVSWPPAASP
jgi:hypothetical protein